MFITKMRQLHQLTKEAEKHYDLLPHDGLKTSPVRAGAEKRSPLEVDSLDL